MSPAITKWDEESQFFTMDKLKILNEIQRIASENGGAAPGRELFSRKTGIKMSDWYPDLWLRWGDALEEAGLPKNAFETAICDNALLEKYICLIRELKRFPLHGEIRRKSKRDTSFPSHTTFGRFGGKEKLLNAVVQYCKNHPGHDDVMALYQANKKYAVNTGLGHRSSAKVLTGFVYLMKSGRHYKIGRTNSVGARERQLAIKIPIQPKTIHSIETDDPQGVEAYWHNRFADKRGEGEWFALSHEDVGAFRRWKRIV